MFKLRASIKEQLNEEILRRINSAPKPTSVAEAIAVTREFEGKALNLMEIAEIANIADPGKDEKSSAANYSTEAMRKHPDLRVIQNPNETYVRYVGSD